MPAAAAAATTLDGTPVPVTRATAQLRRWMAAYDRWLPRWTFPWLPMGVGALFQVLAWTAGSRLLAGVSLGPRMLALWLLAGCEYAFSIVAINAGVEVRALPEPVLVVAYQVVTLVAFLAVNLLVYGNPFRVKYAVSFALLAAAVYTAYL